MIEKYQIGTPSESEQLVRSWGFKHVFTWSDGRYVRQQPHLTTQPTQNTSIPYLLRQI